MKALADTPKLFSKANLPKFIGFILLSVIVLIGCIGINTQDPANHSHHLITPGFYPLYRTIPERGSEDPTRLEPHTGSIVRADIQSVSRPSVALYLGGKYRFECDLNEPQRLEFYLCGAHLTDAVPSSNGKLEICVFRDEKPIKTWSIDYRLQSREKALWRAAFSELDQLTAGHYTIEFNAGQENASDSIQSQHVLFIGSPLILDRLPVETRPNILFIILDALRADFLGAYGDSTPISPFLDQVSKHHMQWTPLVSFSTFTRLSINAIFTGKYRLLSNEFNRRSLDFCNYPDPELILSNRLNRAGYRTFGLSGNILIDPETGYDYGFDTFDSFPGRYYHPGTFDINQERLDALLNPVKTEPWFLYFHCIDPHDPYSPPHPYSTLHLDEPGPKIKTGDGRDRYRGEIRCVDHMLERIFRGLYDQEKMTNTICIIMSDHGEAFGEHGTFTHAKDLHEETLRVPLICMNVSSQKGFIRADGGASVDVYRLIERFAGMEKESLQDAQDPVMEQTDSNRMIISRLHQFNDKDPWHLAMTKDHFKVMQVRDQPMVCYNLDSDPGEKNPVEECAVKSDMDLFLQNNKPRETVIQDRMLMECDPKEMAKLRELGYIN